MAVAARVFFGHGNDMSAQDIFVFTEEPSAKPIIQRIADALEIGNRVRVVEHDGVGDLVRSLRMKIKSDQNLNRKFLVLRDADRLDCNILKRDLIEMIPAGRRGKALVRIVCQELEAWYLAQPAALKKAGVLASEIPAAILRRSPDSVQDPKQVFLKHAHHRGQMDNARKIAPHLDIESKVSASFAHAVLALRRLAAMQP